MHADGLSLQCIASLFGGGIELPRFVPVVHFQVVDLVCILLQTLSTYNGTMKVLN